MGGGPETAPVGELEKLFWIVNVSKYPELRKLGGCEDLTDLLATTTDCKDIMKMAKGLGVKDENIFRDEEATAAQMKKTYMQILKKSRALTAADTPHLIMFYCGGHGATQNEKQVFLLNSDKPADALFQLEFKLRYLVQDPTTKARIFGMYDCCRVPLQNMPALCGRGVGSTEELDEAHEDTTCKYFHIQACGPGGIADADGGFAKRLYQHCVKQAERPPKNELEFPRDWLRVKWAPGEICHSGGDDYSVEWTPQE